MAARPDVYQCHHILKNKQKKPYPYECASEYVLYIWLRVLVFLASFVVYLYRVSFSLVSECLCFKCLYRHIPSLFTIFVFFVIHIYFYSLNLLNVMIPRSLPTPAITFAFELFVWVAVCKHNADIWAFYVRADKMTHTT